ncbi:MAG: oxygenase MpaB family protein [Sphingomonas bacterium]|nr:oxygenase MpaB family protein [Sphingomonas bacterium]
MSRPATSPAEQLRRAIAGRVVALFNDASRGEAPVTRSEDSFFGKDSIAWRVHGDVTSMMVGGMASLMLQMLRPAVLAGVWDHSNFRADMHGRLRRTARFIATTTYGERTHAEAAIERVRRIHDHVDGVLPDGTPYRANDPAALAWVHVTETTSFLAAWRRYGDRSMSRADADRYIAEMASIGRALGADPVPRTVREAEMMIDALRGAAKSDDRTRTVLDLILADVDDDPRLRPAVALIRAAAIDLLPGWARRMHGLSAPVAKRPLVRGGTMALAETIRWSFR